MKRKALLGVSLALMVAVLYMVSYFNFNSPLFFRSLILAAGIIIAVVLILKGVMREVSGWKIAFWVVAISFVAFLVLGISSLMIANSMGEQGWRLLALAFVSLFLAIISLPAVIIISSRYLGSGPKRRD
ncbi:MAG: hypothetical protein V3W01_00775 [Dehalococcoidales bacterium]